MARCREALWPLTGCDRDDPTTWTSAVVRLPDRTDGDFRTVVTGDRLTSASDELVGRGRWLPRGSPGSVVVRFPSEDPTGDDGWHLDGSFPGDAPDDFFAWRINSASRGRALLLLVLLSDVGEHDAPTRLRVGSHLDTARIPAGHGPEGLTVLELSQQADRATAEHDVALATGAAGDVYLCHPFLVHAAQRHRGAVPRFLAQPPLLPRGDLDPVAGTSPLERAIRAAPP